MTVAIAGANGCYREGDIINVRGRLDVSGHFDLLDGVCWTIKMRQKP